MKKGIKVGSLVWYKGETSAGEYRTWKRWKVVGVHDPDSDSPGFVLRVSLPMQHTMCLQYDYAIVDQKWTVCHPDTPKMRTLAAKWNKAKADMEKAEMGIERLSLTGVAQ